MRVCTKFIDVQLGGLYVNFDDCDPECRRSSDAGYVQQRVLQSYSSAKSRATVEYRVLRHVVYPPRHRLAGSGSFIASSPPGGDTEANVDVILIGCSLHASDLCRNKLSCVVRSSMSVDAFRRRYLMPLEEKAVTSAKLCE